jgi:hypothetical protein
MIMENKQPFEFNNDTNIGFTDPFAGKPLNVGGQIKNPIDFLQEKYNSRQVYEESIFDEEFEQAKAIYEQAIINARGDGYEEGLYDGMYRNV